MAISNFWCNIKFSLRFISQNKVIWKGNLAICQKSLKGFTACTDNNHFWDKDNDLCVSILFENLKKPLTQCWPLIWFTYKAVLLPVISAGLADFTVITRLVLFITQIAQTPGVTTLRFTTGACHSANTTVPEKTKCSTAWSWHRLHLKQCNQVPVNLKRREFQKSQCSRQ